MQRKAPMTEQEKFEQQLQLESELGRLAREVTVLHITIHYQIISNNFLVYNHGKRSKSSIGTIRW